MSKPTSNAFGKPTLSRVLIASDLSTHSRRVLRRAATLPLAPKARIELISVVPSSIAGREAISAWRNDVQEEAARLASLLRARGRKDVTVKAGTVTHGRPYEKIVERAEAWGADLIVTGRHGSGGFQSVLIGSTAEKVVRARVAPVLVVSRDSRATYAKPIIAVDPETDFAPFVKEAARVLIPGVARIGVLSAYQVEFERRMKRYYSPKAIREMRKKRAEEAREALNRGLLPLARSLPALEIRVKHGDPRAVIHHAIHNESADLVSLCTNARGGLARYLLGSVSSDVIRTATVDLLIVPYK